MEFLRVKEIKGYLLIGNSLFLAIGQCLLPFQFFTVLALVLPFPRLCLQGRAYLLGIHLALF